MKSEVDFELSTTDFVESLSLERNLGSQHGRWCAGVRSQDLYGIRRGYSLGDLTMRRETRIYNNTFENFRFPNREFLQIARALNLPSRSSITPTIAFTGNPVVRYFFRVRGVAEMVGWGDTFTYNFTKTLEEHYGNKYYIGCVNFMTEMQAENWVYITDWQGGTTNSLVVNPRFGEICVNRTAIPSSFNNIGTYYFDRVVSVSGTATSRPQISLRFANSTPIGNITRIYHGNEGVFQYDNNGGILGSEIQHPGDPVRVMWGNPDSFNPQSMFNEEGWANIFPDGGFTAPLGEETGTTPISMTNLVEAKFLGCRAEVELRPETITDIVAPRLLNDFGQ